MYQAVAYPNDKPSNVHPAHEGPPADGEAAPSGREDKAKYIKSQGSIGGNADDGGLKKKVSLGGSNRTEGRGCCVRSC